MMVGCRVFSFAVICFIFRVYVCDIVMLFFYSFFFPDRSPFLSSLYIESLVADSALLLPLLMFIYSFSFQRETTLSLFLSLSHIHIHPPSGRFAMHAQWIKSQCQHHLLVKYVLSSFLFVLDFIFLFAFSLPAKRPIYTYIIDCFRCGIRVNWSKFHYFPF